MSGQRTGVVGGIRHRVEYALMLGLYAVARLVPLRSTAWLGSFVGGLAWIFSPGRRRVALANLEAALGEEVAPPRRGRVARSAFSQFGRLLVEGLMFPRYSAGVLVGEGGIVRVSGLEHIRGAYAGGRGVILFSAHYGNWEMVALMQGWLGMPLTMVTRPLDNAYLEHLLAGHRSLSGNTIVHKRKSLRPMLATLSKGGGVAIVIDQNVRDGSAVFVDFFGRRAATTPSLALLALRTGAAVIPVFSIPRPDGTYDVEYLPEIVPERTGDLKQDILALTQRCTAVIEGYVRRFPHAWLWMHERWKTRPKEEKKRAA